MIYKIEISSWNDGVEIGDEVHSDDGTKIKVLTIFKVEAQRGDIIAFVQGVNLSDYE